MQYSKKKSPELVEQHIQKQVATTHNPINSAYATTAKPFKDLKKNVDETVVVPKHDIVNETISKPIQQHIIKQPLSEKVILQAWNSYVQSIQKDAQLSAIASQLELSVLDSVITFTVHSVPQKSTFEQSMRIDFLAVLKQQCECSDITITVNVVEQNYDLKPKSKEEIYEFLVKQNPFLQTMKDEFNLEIE
jgi:hypothetical protein